MNNFKSMPATQWQDLCRRASQKMDSLELVSSTCVPGESVLIESSLLMAVNSLAAWSADNG
jgi:hypothetical protein